MSRPSIVAVATMMSDLSPRHPEGVADALQDAERVRPGLFSSHGRGQAVPPAPPIHHLRDGSVSDTSVYRLDSVFFNTLLNTDRRHPRLCPVAGTQARIDDPSQRVDDPYLGNFNGLGGNAEPGEDCWPARREIGEIACTECVDLSCAARSTGSFGKHGEDWLGFILVVTRFDGTPERMNPEGALEWVEMVRSACCRYEGGHHFSACGSTPVRDRSAV